MERKALIRPANKPKAKRVFNSMQPPEVLGIMPLTIGDRVQITGHGDKGIGSPATVDLIYESERPSGIGSAGVTFVDLRHDNGMQTYWRAALFDGVTIKKIETETETD